MDAWGVQVYDYHGKLLCAPRADGIPLDTLAPPMVAISSDTLALLHPATRTSVHFFHVAGGHATAEALRMRREDDSRRLVSDGNVAVMDIVSIALSQTGSQVRPAIPCRDPQLCGFQDDHLMKSEHTLANAIRQYKGCSGFMGLRPHSLA